MEILFSFKPGEDLRKRMERKFPSIRFSYYEKWLDAWDKLPSADALVTYGDDITEQVLDRAEKLQWIMVMSAGVEKLPHQSLDKREILVTNARGIHRIPMAEMAMAYLLHHAKRLAVFHAQQEKRIWNRKVEILELYGKTLLVVGAGAIGSEIGKYAQAFGMKTIGINRRGTDVTGFDEMKPMSHLMTVLPDADYVLSVLPSTPATRGIFTEETFQNMKDGAVFINMGRGDAVNEGALLRALKSGKLAAVYLDVFGEEPLPENSPLWSEENVWITPHISATTAMYLPRAFEIFEENLGEYLRGGKNFINVIDLKRGY
jgi:D-isomer specific 2-hydroxyacid dehydrogenase, NAD binding domain.